jgi:hypothetical protein
MWSWSGRYWHGRNQVEDRSPENVRACYQWLRSLPYQSAEDLARLRELEDERVMQALVERAEALLG